MDSTRDTGNFIINKQIILSTNQKSNKRLENFQKVTKRCFR